MQTVKVLLIDDNTLFRHRVRQFLNDQKTVQVVGDLESGRDIIKIIQLLQPDIVVTDLALPNITGFAIIDQIKRECLHIGIVALTMYDNEEYRQGALNAGSHAFVIKSELKDKLINAVIEAFEIVNHHNE